MIEIVISSSSSSSTDSIRIISRVIMEIIKFLKGITRMTSAAAAAAILLIRMAKAVMFKLQTMIQTTKSHQIVRDTIIGIEIGGFQNDWNIYKYALNAMA